MNNCPGISVRESGQGPVVYFKLPSHKSQWHREERQRTWNEMNRIEEFDCLQFCLCFCRCNGWLLGLNSKCSVAQVLSHIYTTEENKDGKKQNRIIDGEELKSKFGPKTKPHTVKWCLELLTQVFRCSTWLRDWSVLKSGQVEISQNYFVMVVFCVVHQVFQLKRMRNEIAFLHNFTHTKRQPWSQGNGLLV